MLNYLITFAQRPVTRFLIRKKKEKISMISFFITLCAICEIILRPFFFLLFVIMILFIDRKYSSILYSIVYSVKNYICVRVYSEV